jgi:hypothetical protein
MIKQIYGLLGLQIKSINLLNLKNPGSDDYPTYQAHHANQKPSPLERVA